MTQVNFAEGYKFMVIDEPFHNSTALVNLLSGEKLLASIAINVDGQTVDAVWLTGEIGWRITPVTTIDASGRIRIQIKRNGSEIYRKEQDAYIPVGSSCTRSTAVFMHSDPYPGSGSVTYELVASIAYAENLDWFMVTGPVTFFAGGIKKIS